MLCGSPPGVMMADTLSFNAKIGVVDIGISPFFFSISAYRHIDKNVILACAYKVHIPVINKLQ